ncbi:MAG: N-acetylglucosamine-6-phosphate deacetylase [Anaerolineae bacterium]
MPLLLFHSVRVVTPIGLADWLLVDGKQISHVGIGTPPNLPDARVIYGAGGWLLPGFIDLHVHGSDGVDTMDATPEALHTMARFFAQHGVTGFLATTVTAPREAIRRALANAAACLGTTAGGASLLGVHLEGPYINLKAKGAQAGEFVRLADTQEWAEWREYGVIRQITAAPEFPENLALLDSFAASGGISSIGHTQATYDEAIRAIQGGARQVTHCFNAMTGIHHRNPGVAGAALTQDSVKAEIIADFLHLHPAILDLIVRAKGTSGVIAITDAIEAAGQPEGEYDLGGLPVLVRDGKATLADGTLAGSVLTMDQAFRNLAQATNLLPDQLVPIFSTNAAKQLGLADRKGVLAAGFDADLVLMSDALHVKMTLVGGQVAYQA